MRKVRIVAKEVPPRSKIAIPLDYRGCQISASSRKLFYGPNSWADQGGKVPIIYSSSVALESYKAAADEEEGELVQNRNSLATS